MSLAGFHAVAVAVAVSSLMALPAQAAPSKRHQEWRQGPEQWIMTAQEKRDWRAVDSDEEAVRFIDLFWARRDPTIGTPKNEYREDFASRILFADTEYEERGRRGALTDRGRVFLLLGPPTNAAEDVRRYSHQTLAPTSVFVKPAPGTFEGDRGEAGGGRMRGASNIWIWEREDASRFDMPKIEVAFVEEPGTGKMTRELTRRDYPRAEAAAIRRSVVNPDLTEVPDWALHGGPDPVFMLVDPSPASTPASAATGVLSSFMLLHDVNAINLRSETNPLQALEEATAFKPNAVVGWVAQYCSASEQVPTLRFSLRVTGTIDGKVVDRVTEPSEKVPDRLRSDAACSLLRGAVVFDGLKPGDYRLTLRVEDVGVPGGSTQTRDLRIE